MKSSSRDSGREAAASPLAEGASYAGAHYLAAAFHAISGLLVRVWVPPALFGATSLVTGVQGHFRAIDGIPRSAIDRELPSLRGARKSTQGQELLVAAFTLQLLSAALLGVVFVAAGVVASQPYLRWAWWAFACSGVLEAFNSTDRITLKAQLRFGEHNRLLVRGTFASAGLLILLSWIGGATGYLVGTVCGAIVVFALTRTVTQRSWVEYFVTRPSPVAMLGVLRVGATISIFKVAQQLLLTADRFLVAGLLSLEALGYYSLGSVLAAQLSQLPLTLAGAYAPRLNEAIGAGRTSAARRGVEYLHRLSVLTSVIGAGVVILLAGPLIELALPQYSQASRAVEVMVLGAYFAGATGVSTQVHIALKHVSSAVVITVLAVAVTIGAGWVFSFSGLVGIAAGKALGIGVYSLLLDASAARLLGARRLVLVSTGGAAALLVEYLLATLVGPITAVSWLIMVGVLGVRHVASSAEWKLGWNVVLRRAAGRRQP